MSTHLPGGTSLTEDSRRTVSICICLNTESTPQFGPVPHGHVDHVAPHRVKNPPPPPRSNPLTNSKPPNHVPVTPSRTQCAAVMIVLIEPTNPAVHAALAPFDFTKN